MKLLSNSWENFILIACLHCENYKRWREDPIRVLDFQIINAWNDIAGISRERLERIWSGCSGVFNRHFCHCLIKVSPNSIFSYFNFLVFYFKSKFKLSRQKTEVIVQKLKPKQSNARELIIWFKKNHRRCLMTFSWFLHASMSFKCVIKGFLDMQMKLT